MDHPYTLQIGSAVVLRITVFGIYSYLDGFVFDAYIFIIAKHPETI